MRGGNSNVLSWRRFKRERNWNDTRIKKIAIGPLDNDMDALLKVGIIGQLNAKPHGKTKTRSDIGVRVMASHQLNFGNRPHFTEVELNPFLLLWRLRNLTVKTELRFGLICRRQ